MAWPFSGGLSSRGYLKEELLKRERKQNVGQQGVWKG